MNDFLYYNDDDCYQNLKQRKMKKRNFEIDDLKKERERIKRRNKINRRISRTFYDSLSDPKTQ